MNKQIGPKSGQKIKDKIKYENRQIITNYNK